MLSKISPSQKVTSCGSVYITYIKRQNYRAGEQIRSQGFGRGLGELEGAAAMKKTKKGNMRDPCDGNVFWLDCINVNNLAATLYFCKKLPLEEIG